MPVCVGVDTAGTATAYCAFNEGLGRALRYGANGPDVLDRLRWFRDVFGPLVGAALRAGPPIELRRILAEAVQMGDECHNRNKAATSLLLPRASAAAGDERLGERRRGGGPALRRGERPLRPELLDAGGQARRRCGEQRGRQHPGHDHGAQRRRSSASASAGSAPRWFTGPCQTVDGLYFAGFGPADANPDIGDSAITETTGLGGFAMAAAPAIVQFIGGTPADALAIRGRCTRSPSPSTTPTACRSSTSAARRWASTCAACCAAASCPVINTGIAHREPGIGQVGAGVVHPPAEAFVAAGRALAESANGQPPAKADCRIHKRAGAS